MCTKNVFTILFVFFLAVFFTGCENPADLLEEKTRETEELNGRIRTLKERIKKIGKAREEDEKRFQTDKKALDAQILAMKDKIDRIKTTVEFDKETIKSYEKTVKSNQDTADALKDELDRLEADKIEQDKLSKLEINKLKSKIEIMKEEAESEYSIKDSIIEAKDTEIDKLENKLVRFEKAADGERRKLEANIELTKERIKRALAEVETIRQKINLAENKIKRRNNHIDALKKQLNGLRGITGPTKYALVLEGGGTRGIMAAVFLKLLEEQVLNSQEEDKNTIPEFFDFISGSSIGGINALFLASDISNISKTIGVPDTSAASLLEVYSSKNIAEIFDYDRGPFGTNIYGYWRPMYPEKGKFLKRLYGEGEAEFGLLKKPVLIPVYDYANHEAYYFSSYSGRDKSVKVWEIAEGTSAAPAFFSPVTINTTDKDGSPKKMFALDGSLLSNNTCVNVYSELRKKFPKDEIKILSVSAGRFAEKMKTDEEAEDWQDSSSASWMNSGKLIERMISAPGINAALNCEAILKDNFMHIPFSDVQVTKIDDIETETLEVLKQGSEEEFNRMKDEVKDFLLPPVTSL